MKFQVFVLTLYNDKNYEQKLTELNKLLKDGAEIISENIIASPQTSMVYAIYRLAVKS